MVVLVYRGPAFVPYQTKQIDGVLDDAHNVEFDHGGDHEACHQDLRL